MIASGAFIRFHCRARVKEMLVHTQPMHTYEPNRAGVGAPMAQEQAGQGKARAGPISQPGFTWVGIPTNTPFWVIPPDAEGLEVGLGPPPCSRR